MKKYTLFSLFALILLSFAGCMIFYPAGFYNDVVYDEITDDDTNDNTIDDGNLLDNGSFTDWSGGMPDYWETNESTIIQSEGAIIQSFLTNYSAPSSFCFAIYSQGEDVYLTQVKKDIITQNHTYKLSFVYQLIGVNGPYLDLHLYFGTIDTAGAFIYNQETSLTNLTNRNEWVTEEITYTPDSASDSVRLEFVSTSPAGNSLIFIDDVFLEEVN